MCQQNLETLREAARQPQPQSQLTAAKAIGALEATGKLATEAHSLLKALGTLFGL